MEPLRASIFLPHGRRALTVAMLTSTLHSVPAHATADGPDHYRVHAVAPGSHLNLRAEPSTSAPVLARIPADAACLASLGCRGGLTFQEFTTLSAAERHRREQEHPRWCKVDYRGTVGWVAGRYLAEAACVAPSGAGHTR
jgi:uncharacterized protein YraI